MRNQHFEVPFIAFYRKEYVLPELNVNDLWKVYKYDGKVCQFYIKFFLGFSILQSFLIFKIFQYFYYKVVFVVYVCSSII